MSDLTDDQLRDVEVGLGSDHLRDAVGEIRRRRAEQAAGREHVERVVLQEMSRAYDDRDVEVGEEQNVAASRVADRLSVPVLSEEDVEQLRWNRRELVAWGQGIPVDVIDRLIAAGKP